VNRRDVRSARPPRHRLNVDDVDVQRINRHRLAHGGHEHPRGGDREHHDQKGTHAPPYARTSRKCSAKDLCTKGGDALFTRLFFTGTSPGHQYHRLRLAAEPSIISVSPNTSHRCHLAFTLETFHFIRPPKPSAKRSRRTAP